MKGKDKIIGRKLEKTVLHKELHKEKLDDLYFSRNIFRRSNQVVWDNQGL
jgi:hypothetical protein